MGCKIEKKSSGYLLTFSGVISKGEMEAWLAQSKQVLASAPPQFGVIIDMRTLAPLGEDVQPVLQEGQKLYKKAGMQRSAVIVANSMVNIQLKKVAQQTGIYAFERYIDASANPDWAGVAKNWVVDGTDPDA